MHLLSPTAPLLLTAGLTLLACGSQHAEGAVRFATQPKQAMQPTHSPAANAPDDPEIAPVIEDFATAAAARDTAALGSLLHEDFRVIANDFPAPGKLTTLNRAAYLGAMAAGKLGGEPHEAVTAKFVDVQANTAVAVYDLVTAATVMHVAFVLVRGGGEGPWRIVSDTAFVEPR